MKSIKELGALLGDFKSGSIRALSRCISLIEEFPQDRQTIISKLKSSRPTPLIIGFTGPPGVGKSSIINKMLFRFVKRYKKIAVLAFDPSSSISHGALLGDRIRMNEHLDNENIFIRSFASRGEFGGLSSVIYDILEVLFSFGFDLILIETVGTGQNEIEIAQVADATVVVLDPLSGDSIQALKAGIMEIGDIYAVNKNDVVPSATYENNIQQILWDKHKRPKIVPCNAQSIEGIDYLFENIQELISEYRKGNILVHKRSLRYENYVKSIVEYKILEYYRKKFNEYYSRVSEKNKNPYEITSPFLEKHLR